MILSILQAHFNVKTILMPGGRGTPVDIIGAAADIDFAIYAFNYLRQTFFRCWNEFKRTHANPDKASYYRGLRDGLNAELKAAKQRAEQSYAADQRQAYGLVGRGPGGGITRYVEDHYGKLRTRRNAAATPFRQLLSPVKPRAAPSRSTARSPGETLSLTNNKQPNNTMNKLYWIVCEDKRHHAL
jgi:hypothetical protein